MLRAGESADLRAGIGLADIAVPSASLPNSASWLTESAVRHVRSGSMATVANSTSARMRGRVSLKAPWVAVDVVGPPRCLESLFWTTRLDSK